MFKDGLLKGKRILITGGGTGLGKEIAAQYLSLGADLWICGRRGSVLDATAKELTARHGGSVRTHAVDIRDAQAVDAMAQRIWDESGPLTGLVNNAAGNFIARTEKLSPNAFNTVVGIVLNGTFHCTQTFARRWIAASKPGNVLNIVTTYADCGSGFVVPSACAKAGVLAMTRSLVVEWAKYHIRLNAIAPGPFPTEGAWSRLMPTREFEDQARNSHPMKRFGRHDELANLAVYLLSSQAEYVNGECVVIDGGLWLRGAGEFNDLLMLPDSAWDAMEQGRKKGGQGAS